MGGRSDNFFFEEFISSFFSLHYTGMPAGDAFTDFIPPLLF